MMGLAIHCRRAAIRRMAGNTGVTALVPATSIFGQTQPPNVTWPFIRTGVPQVLPIRAGCLLGGTVNLPVDAFAGPRRSGGQIIETAEDHAGFIGAAIEFALQDQGETITVAGQSVRLTYRLSDMRLFRDGAEADAFHWSGLLAIRAVAE